MTHRGKDKLFDVHAFVQGVGATVMTQTLNWQPVNHDGHLISFDRPAANTLGVGVDGRCVDHLPIELGKLLGPGILQVIAGSGHYLLEPRYFAATRQKVAKSGLADAPTVAVSVCSARSAIDCHGPKFIGQLPLVNLSQ